MGITAVGSVVLIKFPHSDLKSYKLRPALVVGLAEFNDIVLCQITSNGYSSKNVVTLRATGFTSGGLPVESFIRPDKLFATDSKIVSSQLGMVSTELMKTVRHRLGAMLGL